MNQDPETLWRDEKNWSGSIYFCKDDSRLVVPKRTRMLGWTINFGHSSSTFALVAFIVLPALLSGAVLGVVLSVVLRR